MLIRIPKIGPRGHQLLEQFLQETDSWYYIWCFIFLRNETLENWTVNSLEITMYCQKMLVYIDKSLIGYEARGPAIQYVPNKHHRSFSFKLFCLCGSESGYTYNFSFNEGKQNSRSEIRISHDTCTELWLLYLVRGNIFLQITGILQSL